MENLREKFLFGNADFRKAVAAEARWQLQRTLDEGVVLSHIDGHQHLHVLPGVWPICFALAREAGIPRVRVSASASVRLIKPNFAGVVLHTLSVRCGSQLPAYLRCIGLANPGRFTLDVFQREMQLMTGNERDLELVAHPGVDNQAIQPAYPHWPFDWRGELDALLEPRFLDIVQEAGYRLAAGASDADATHRPGVHGTAQDVASTFVPAAHR